MTFQGFGAEAVEFWEQLDADNTSTFWKAHRPIYDRSIAEPLAALAGELTAEFGEIRRFRPQRDTRFSTDKRPYQTFCSRAATTAAGIHALLYFQFGVDAVLVAGGCWQPDNATLTAFRQAVDNPTTADSFDDTLAQHRGSGFTFDGDALKTAPRGWPHDHPRIDLLRLRNLALQKTFAPQPWLHTAQCREKVAQSWRTLGVWNNWLATHLSSR